MDEYLASNASVMYYSLTMPTDLVTQGANSEIFCLFELNQETLHLRIELGPALQLQISYTS